MIDLKTVSLCLLTKEVIYPQVILDSLPKFGEVIVGTNSPTPYMKHILFKRAKFDLLAYQDDDALCPWKELAELSKPDIINLAIKQGHFEQYKDMRQVMGLGWGAIFPKSILASLKKYTDKYGFDAVFQRDTERILTYLNFPQNRLVLPIIDLPSAYAEDRLWRQPKHYDQIKIVEERCKVL